MPKKQPDDLARLLGHLIVGGAAAIVTAKLAKHAVPAILLAIVAMAIHAEMDAPVAKALSEAGL